MAIDPITTNGPTITVSTAAELWQAYKLLSHQDGGGKILVEPGSYDAMVLYQYGTVDGDQPVIIASKDPDDPAHFSQINLRACTNVRIESVHVDSTGVERAGWETDLIVQDADTIQIVDSTFIHDPGDALKATGNAVESLGGFRQSTNVIFEDNYVDGYFLGLDIMDTVNFEVVGNEITNLQSDGIRGGGMQDGLISDNYIHDIYPVTQSITHSDLIQIWGINAEILTQNVTISDNVLLNSDAATQGIFIRSGELGKDNSVTSGYFQNITITNNLLYTAHIHGITVDDVDGLVVDGNTVLWNPEATMFFDSGDPINYQPIIYTRGSINVEATDNIAALVKGENLTLSADDGNQIVTYHNPAEFTYAGHHFVNPFAGAEVTPSDLQMLPTSPWYGLAGSTIGNSPGDISDGVTAVITVAAPDDQYELTYDAGSSFDAAGAPLSAGGNYSFHWSFADGTSAEGMSVTKIYEEGGFKGVALEIRQDGETAAEITRNFAIQFKDIFAFDFETGVVDVSNGVPEVIDNGTTTASDDGTGFLIGDGNKLELGRDTQGLFEMDSFGLAFDMKMTGDEGDGTFLHLYQTMEGKILNDGSVQFSLSTDQGGYSLTSRDPIFDDGDTHRIGIAFDGETGQLELFADGESVSSVEAWGTTPSAKYWNLVFGNTWQDSVDAIIDNVEMSVDPAIAGDLPVIDPPAEDPPANDPPAEDPPANDPPAEDPPAEDPPAEDPPAEDPPAEDPPAEDPPAEDPPAKDPPAEDPPAEDPPAEDPPAEDPPAEDPGDRGAPPEPVESGGGSKFFLLKILEAIFSIFGGGRDDPPSAPATEQAAVKIYDTMLADVVPVTEMVDEEASTKEDDDDELTDLAA